MARAPQATASATPTIPITSTVGLYAPRRKSERRICREVAPRLGLEGLQRPGRAPVGLHHGQRLQLLRGERRERAQARLRAVGHLLQRAGEAAHRQHRERHHHEGEQEELRVDEQAGDEQRDNLQPVLHIGGERLRDGELHQRHVRGEAGEQLARVLPLEEGRRLGEQPGVEEAAQVRHHPLPQPLHPPALEEAGRGLHRRHGHHQQRAARRAAARPAA